MTILGSVSETAETLLKQGMLVGHPHCIDTIIRADVGCLLCLIRMTHLHSLMKKSQLLVETFNLLRQDKQAMVRSNLITLTMSKRPGLHSAAWLCCGKCCVHCSREES